MTNLHNALLILLRTLNCEEKIFARIRSCSGVPETFKAIAACTAFEEFDRKVAAHFAEHTSEIPVPSNMYPSTNAQLLKLFEMLANEDPAVKLRVERLATAAGSSITPPVTARKCSNPACGKLEGSEKFKMCRGCLLEIYCSTGE